MLINSVNDIPFLNGKHDNRERGEIKKTASSEIVDIN